MIWLYFCPFSSTALLTPNFCPEDIETYDSYDIDRRLKHHFDKEIFL